jgi:AraC-like DNA-binding protein
MTDGMVVDSVIGLAYSAGMTDPTLPQRAVAAFERATGLTVVFHCLAGPLAGAFSPERSWHTGSLCRTVKHLRFAACMAFDVDLAHRTARAGPEVRLKICHAGIVEWLVGVHVGGQMTAVLYAGQRRAMGPLTGALEPLRRLPHRGSWSPQVAALPPVDAEEAGWIGELLAQLAARLAAWCGEQASAAPVSRASTGTAATEGADRRAVIRRFIHENQLRETGLPALARVLGLSPTRAGHVVRELFGRSYLALRDETRLRAAADMLRATTLPLPAVAAACGFRDPSRFHRIFRRVHGMTPGEHRRGGMATAQP